jgi:hypothetical protein
MVMGSGPETGDAFVMRSHTDQGPGVAGVDEKAGEGDTLASSSRIV